MHGPEQTGSYDPESGNSVDGDTRSSRRRTTTIRHHEITEYPAQPDVVQYVQGPKTHVNHTYYNFSNMPRDPLYSMPSHTERMTFHEKIYHLLSNPTSWDQAVRWCFGGRAFEIVDSTAVTRNGVMEEYFDCRTILQFRRQLLCHGYKRLLGKVRAETYYSEFQLQGLPHVLQLSPEPFDCRALMSDVENEPDFKSINRLYPLPGEHQLGVVNEARTNLSAKGLVVCDSVFNAVAQKWTQHTP